MWVREAWPITMEMFLLEAGWAYGRGSWEGDRAEGVGGLGCMRL